MTLEGRGRMLSRWEKDVLLFSGNNSLESWYSRCRVDAGCYARPSRSRCAAAAGPGGDEGRPRPARSVRGARFRHRRASGGGRGGPLTAPAAPRHASRNVVVGRALHGGLQSAYPLGAYRLHDSCWAVLMSTCTRGLSLVLGTLVQYCLMNSRFKWTRGLSSKTLALASQVRT